MFCHECGAEIDDNSKFCKECGAKLSANVSSEKTEINDESKDTEIKTIDEKFANDEEGNRKEESSKPTTITEIKSKYDSPEKYSDEKFLLGCCIGLVIIFIIIAMIGSSHDATENTTYTKNSSSVDEVKNSDSSSNEPTEEEYKANCTELDYKNYMKNPSKYSLDDVKVSGEVLQIMEDSTGGTILLFQNGDSNQVIYITYDGSNDVVDGDYITVYGSAYNTYTYTSQANYRITCPFISAKYIEK